MTLVKLTRMVLMICSLTLVVVGVSVPAAGASTYTNPSPIAFSNGPASPYPSPITVEGLPPVVSEVRVTLTGIVYPFPRDIDALLVGPGGASSILISDVCGNNTTPFGGTTLTFDDAATATVPAAGVGPCPSGTYKPADAPVPEVFPAPAPAGPYTATLSAFNGGPSNGSWQLYVVDDQLPDSGSIAGWTLELRPHANCGGFAPATPAMIGTAGNDKLVGTPGLDAILGLGGKDTIKGLGGDDQICGGPGNDTLKGGAGVDNLKGEGGKDKLQGQGGRDKCIGGKKRDTASSCEVEKSI